MRIHDKLHTHIGVIQILCVDNYIHFATLDKLMTIETICFIYRYK